MFLEAQISYLGHITDLDNNAISEANVLVREFPEGPLLSFSISDAQGKFKIDINKDLDSIHLSITHLSFRTKKLWVNSKSPSLIKLSNQEYVLPEMIIENPPIKQRGDTLVFDVNQYRQANDQNIEQVLKRIPGITVTTAGVIKFRGLEISKFYIEGLDMLEGRYRIATRNLSIDAIRDIEVLEHHQAVRALDSLVRPPNAAINIRLKSGLSLAGGGKAGIGFSPTLHLLHGTLFGFSKKQQFNALTSSNNIGIQQFNDFRNLYTLSQDSYRAELLNLSAPLRPIELAPELALNNRETTGGVNFLRKLNKDLQLKWQSNLRKEKIFEQGTYKSFFFGPDSTFGFDEELNASNQVFNWNNQLTLELNAKRLFFRLDLDAEWQDVNAEANNLINQEGSTEYLGKDELDLNTRIVSIIRRKNRAYKINSDVSFQKQKANLALTPVDIFTPTLPLTRFQLVKQRAQLESFKWHTYSSIFFRILNYRGQLDLGLHLQQFSLKTDLLSSDELSSEQFLGADFLNSTQTNRSIMYVNQTYERDIKNFKIILSLPLAIHSLHLLDQQSQQKEKHNLLVTMPSIKLNYRISSTLNWNTDYHYKLNYNQDQVLFHNNYILRSNRNLQNALFGINQFKQHRINTRFSGLVLDNNLEYGLAFELIRGASQYTPSYSLNTQSRTTDLVEIQNRFKKHKISGELAGNLFKNLDYELRAQYLWNKRPVILNEGILDLSNEFIKIQPKLYYNFSSSIFSVKSSWQKAKNDFLNGPNAQVQVELVYFLQLKKLGSFQLSYDQFFTKVSQKKIWNEYLHFEFKRKFNKGKFEIKLRINNISNEINYNTFELWNFRETSGFYHIRPRQVFFSIGKQL